MLTGQRSYNPPHNSSSITSARVPPLTTVQLSISRGSIIAGAYAAESSALLCPMLCRKTLRTSTTVAIGQHLPNCMRQPSASVRKRTEQSWVRLLPQERTSPI